MTDTTLIKGLSITLARPLTREEASDVLGLMLKTVAASKVEAVEGRYRPCGFCGEPMELSSKGARCTRQYCNSSCRVNANRKKGGAA